MLRKLVIILILASLLALAACAPTPAPTEEITEVSREASSEAATKEQATQETLVYDSITLTINYSALTSFAPIFIAEAEGYFAEYGITLEHVDIRSNQAVPLIISGDLDILAGSLNTGLLNVIALEPGIKVVANRGRISQSDDCTYVGILVRKDLSESGEISGPADLAGRIIVGSNAGSTGYTLSRYLEQAGLTLEDITLSDLPTSGYLDAFANKTVDAIVVPELHITRLLNDGNAEILISTQDIVGNLQLSLMVFGKSIMEDNPEAGARFLAGYLKGIQQYNEGKTERNLQIMADTTGESIEMLQASCWLPISMDGMIDYAGVEDFQQWSYEQGQLDNMVTEEQFWDPSFLLEAQKLLNP